MNLSHRAEELLPPAASDCVSGVRLEKSEETFIINRRGRSTHPEEKSVLRSGATPVHWYPLICDGLTGARIRISQFEVPLIPAMGFWRAELPGSPKPPLIARVILKSGQVSSPVIVHEEIALQRAAPGQVDRRLREALDRIRSGSEDLIDLAQHAHLIFSPDPARAVEGRGRREVTGRRTPDAKGISYTTSEEFRKAVALAPATGTTGRFSLDDPGLLQVLSIVMRGAAGIGTRAEEEAREEEEDRALLEGDTEDGNQQSNEEEGDDKVDRKPSKRLGDGYFTDQQIEHRRKQLMKAMDAFEELLRRLNADPSLVSTRLAAQTAFMIQLMMLACTLEHKRQSKCSVRLMVFFPNHDSERERSFALRVARILWAIWVGKNNNALARYIFVEARHQSLPDDLVAWIVLSRWAVARANLAASKTDGIFRSKIDDLAKKVYISTATLGPIAPEAEIRMMMELDARAGFTTAETEALVRSIGLLVPVRDALWKRADFCSTSDAN